MPEDFTRRRLFGLAGSIALLGTAAPGLGRLDSGADGQRAGGRPAGGDSPDRSARPDTLEEEVILEGTEHETPLYVRRSPVDGPTVMVVGGVHGDETSGFRTADDVRTWSIDAGTLVVLPEANRVAIERRSRYGQDGDLNRHFPAGEDPTSTLAEAIWEAVLRHEPDTFIDLHRALGIYPGDPTGVEVEVGQAIFHSGGDAADLAATVAGHANANLVPDSRPQYEFETAHFDYGMEPSGLLATKVALDLHTPSFLVEVTSEDLDLETRVRWMTGIVRRFLVEEGVVGTEKATEDAETMATPEEPQETTTTSAAQDNHPPEAAIETSPPDADATTLARGDTVALDGSGSRDGDGEITATEWDLNDDGTFERTGGSVEVTLTECGSFPITLRVTDEHGATATETVTLRTVAPE